jgi:5-methylcytosine-specific restriction endonuclease McrA
MIPKGHSAMMTLFEYIPVDEMLRTRTCMRISEMYRAKALAKRAEWWEEYSAYLRSPQWYALRSQILERDEYRCQTHFEGCTATADHVHHLTYDRMGAELYEDLVSVCLSCHTLIHPHMETA